jgi:phage repressor protein C with HTH and peptisase S24 domain
VALVARALSRLSGVEVSAEQVLTGRLAPEQFATRAVAALAREVEALERTRVPLGGIRLPRFHLGALPAGPVKAFEPGDAQQVVRADPGDFVVTADGDCMVPTVCHGDELICVFSDQATDGDVVVASYADDRGEWQSGVKRLRRETERAWLTCDNRSADPLGHRLYPDIHPAQIRLHGVVVGLWRPLRREK